MPKAVTPWGLEPRPLFWPVFLSHSLCCLPVDSAFAERRDGGTGPSPGTCAWPAIAPLREWHRLTFLGNTNHPIHHRPQMRCLIDTHISLNNPRADSKSTFYWAKNHAGGTGGDGRQPPLRPSPRMLRVWSVTVTRPRARFPLYFSG